MSKNETKLTTKVSSLISGQSPDFVQSDHPLFVKFLKDYYQFLEAGRLTITATIQNIVQETVATNYILQEDDERTLAESSSGKFVNGETITGGTSNATATILVEDSRNKHLYITSQQLFITGETITGGTSGSTATIDEYRANPVQNIQQLLEYGNTDTTIFDFLEKLRLSFMSGIPSSLASGTSKRNLIKSIKDLYAAKGTSEGVKLFSRLFLGEEASILYPNQFLMKPSDGDFRQRTIIRVSPDGGVVGSEVIGQVITGASSGATAVVETSVEFQQQGVGISELQVANLFGTFTDGEKITATSTTRDLEVGFTIRPIVASGSVTSGGILHDDNEDITLESIGNQSAVIKVGGIGEGSVSGIEIDDAGTKYEVGETITFTPISADTNVESAVGFISMVGGGIQLETGTLEDSSFTDDAIILESGTKTHLEPFRIVLEQNSTDKFKGDGTTKVFTLTNLNATTETLTVFIDNVERAATNKDDSILFTLSGTTLTFQDAPEDNVRIDIISDSVHALVLNGTDISSTDVGHDILLEASANFEQKDDHTTSTDQIVLEFGTFDDLGEADNSGAIQKIHISDGGGGYTDIPTLSINTTTGTGAKIVAVTDNIGSLSNVFIQDSGFAYDESNPPEMTPQAHFVVKDVSGTFESGNTLTSHVGTIKGFDSTTGVLDTTFENVVRVEQESSSTFQEGVQLEEYTLKDEDIAEGLLLEETQDFELDNGDSIILDGTEIVTPDPDYVVLRVKVVSNPNTEVGGNIYQIDSVNRPILTFTKGSTYYFDLSDSSLYNAVVGNNHILRISTTSDGTHGSGSEYTTGVTKSAAFIEIGTTGAFIQIKIASDAPDLFYYCANHAGMGNKIEVKEIQTFLRDNGDNLVLDGSATTIFGLLLEDSLGNGFIREEGLTLTRPSQINLDQTDSSGTDQNSNILLEDASSDGETSIIIKEGDETVETTGIEDTFGGTILLEMSTLDRINATEFASQTSSTIGGIFVQDENEKILLNRFQEIDTIGKLLFDATDSSGTNEGLQVATENAGDSLILNGSDASSTDANSKVLGEDETGSGDILLDGTDSSSTDAGNNIINEDAIDFSKKNVTITDSTGASATIVKANIASITSSVSTTQTNAGSYASIQSLLGEDLNRIQDSLYYQDYSYEVQVGVSFSDYIKELQKAVHPAGFKPFGKVSIASQVSVAISTTATDVPDYTGDDLFTPELASTLVNIFQVELDRRLEAPVYNVGDTDDQILFENGLTAGDKIILDAKSTTSTTTSNTDFSILLEDSLQPTGYGYDTAYIILDSSDVGFVDEHSKLDLESGVLFGELDGLILEPPPISIGDTTFTTGIILADTDGTNSTMGALTFVTSFETLGFVSQQPDQVNFTTEIEQAGTEFLLLEDAFTATGDNVLLEDLPVTGTGRLMSESAPLVESGNAELVLLKDTKIKLAQKPIKRVVTNLLVELANNPFGGNPDGVQLENGEVGKFESGIVVLDGLPPLELNAPILLEGDEDLDHIILETGGNILMETGHRTLNEDQGFTTTGELDRVELERGGFLLSEDGQFPPSSLPADLSFGIGDRIVLEDFDNVLPPLSELTDLKFEDILKPSKIILNDPPNDQNNAHADENIGILLEDFGRLQLDGTDSDSSDVGSFVAAEEDTNIRFVLEESGSLLTEEASTHSFDDKLKLETTLGEQNIELETVSGIGNLALESFEIILEEGQIPFGNLTLNSSTNAVGGQKVTRGSIINVRTTGEVVLEDGTQDNIGEQFKLVLDGTDGSSTDAGDNIDFEGATGIIP